MHKRAKNKTAPVNIQLPCTDMPEETMESFEAELCWCIKQLQRGLQLGKLNAKQIQDHMKALNTLTSKTTSIIKKRQIMRLSFGDYRSKMAEDDKKFNKINQQVKVTTKKPSIESKFIKKSTNNFSKSTFLFTFDIVENNEAIPKANLG